FTRVGLKCRRCRFLTECGVPISEQNTKFRFVHAAPNFNLVCACLALCEDSPFKKRAREWNGAPTAGGLRLTEVILCPPPLPHQSALHGNSSGLEVYVRPLEPQVFFRSHPSVYGKIKHHSMLSLISGFQECLRLFRCQNVEFSANASRELSVRRRIGNQHLP